MGLLDDLGEYLRRSGRNLGMGADAAIKNAQANNAAIRGGADATLLQMQGTDLSHQQQEALHNSPIGGFGPESLGAGGGLLGTYVGVGARNVPRRALSNAKNAARNGVDNEAVRQKYGWFQDKTGDWKFEVSDHQASLSYNPNTGAYKLRHPELQRQYPDLIKNLKIESMDPWLPDGSPNPNLAEYHPDQHTAKLNPDLARTDPEEALKALIHEIQHAIQEKEGFSPGTMPNSDAVIQRFMNEYLRDSVQARSRGEEMPQPPDWMFRKYETALGETEARDTMNRLRLTPDQRRAQQPYAGEGIPASELWDVRDYLPPDTSRSGLLSLPEGLGVMGGLLGATLPHRRAE